MVGDGRDVGDMGDTRKGAPVARETSNFSLLTFLSLLTTLANARRSVGDVGDQAGASLAVPRWRVVEIWVMSEM